MNNKSRVLYIQRFLELNTDETHPASLVDIIAYLESMGIPASRKTAAADIERLIEAGVDVVCDAGRRYEYFIGDRHFELPELKMLVDAVQAARFISSRKSRTLVSKLTSLASVHQAEELCRHLHMDHLSKSSNEKMYLTADLLNTAINAGKQVCFKYYEYTRDKKKTYKHNGKVYVFSPYGLIWNDDNYYVAGYSESHGKIITFRVDRIAVPEITDTSAAPIPEGFDMADYAVSVFKMFDGPLRDVTLKCESTLMKSMIDRFGEDVETTPMGAEHFIAHVSVSASRTFFGWVFSFGGAIEILSPDDVAGQYVDMAVCVAKKPVK